MVSSKRLLLARELSVSLLWNLEALLSRVQNCLYLLEETALVFFERRVGIHRLLDEKFYVPQLAEVEVALALKTLNSLRQLGVLLLQQTASGCGLTTA